jgi:hypothetical protein
VGNELLLYLSENNSGIATSFFGGNSKKNHKRHLKEEQLSKKCQENDMYYATEQTNRSISL